MKLLCHWSNNNWMLSPDVTKAESKATYGEIQTRVREQSVRGR